MWRAPIRLLGPPQLPRTLKVARCSWTSWPPSAVVAVFLAKVASAVNVPEAGRAALSLQRCSRRATETENWG